MWVSQVYGLIRQLAHDLVDVLSECWRVRVAVGVPPFATARRSEKQDVRGGNSLQRVPVDNAGLELLMGNLPGPDQLRHEKGELSVLLRRERAEVSQAGVEQRRDGL